MNVISSQSVSIHRYSPRTLPNTHSHRGHCSTHIQKAFAMCAADSFQWEEKYFNTQNFPHILFCLLPNFLFLFWSISIGSRISWTLVFQCICYMYMCVCVKVNKLFNLKARGNFFGVHQASFFAIEGPPNKWRFMWWIRIGNEFRRVRYFLEQF